MSTKNETAYYNNSGTKVTVDPEVLKRIFGEPKDSEKPEEIHPPSERNGDNDGMANPSLQLLPTTNDQNNVEQDPEVDELQNNSVPNTDSQPRLPSADHNDISADGPNNTRVRFQPKQTHKDGDNDHFQWFSNDEDQDTGGLESRFGEPGVLLPPPTATPDVNAYQQRKNLAHGMMDLALLSANATQLRSVMEAPAHPYFYPGVLFISLSIVLQVTVGILLILNSRYDVTKKSEIERAIKVNDFTVVGVFIVTIVNVFIASFIGTSPAVGTAPQQAG